MAAAGSESVFFCVAVKDGPKVIKPKAFMRFNQAQTLREVVVSLAEEVHGAVTDVYTFKSVDSTDGTIADFDTPLSVLVSFGQQYIEIRTRSIDELPAKKHCNVFDVMMTMAKSRNWLPEKKTDTNRANNRLYNMLVDVLEERKVGFSSSNQSIGKKVVQTLSDVLWYLDPHCDKFKERGLQFPSPFDKVNGFSDYKAAHKKTPVLQANVLKQHMENLSDVLMLPWFQHEQFLDFRSRTVGFLDEIEKYYNILLRQQGRNAEDHHKKTDTIVHHDDKWTMKVIEGSDRVVPEEYRIIAEELKDMDFYQPLCLLELEPIERFERRKWYDRFDLCYPVQLYSHKYGNYLGNLTFVWRLPLSDDNRDGNGSVKAVLVCKDMVPRYSSRAMRKTFIDKYAKASGAQPALLRDAFRFLTNDSSAAECSAEAKIDDRVTEFLLLSGDTDLFQDMRNNNGRPKNEKFNAFWDELQKYLESNSVVDDRREGGTFTYMPCAISLEDLCRQVSSALPEGTPIPSTSWVRFNFWPANPYTRTAAQYTGRFNVKYAVQQRLLRAQHVDAKYVACQFRMMKEMAVKYRDHAAFISVDDKAIVPVGEPNLHLSTGVRAHNSALVFGETTLAALDHDFHICGIVPSVLFNIDIPDDATGSFYGGKIHVTLKDKVFEPSNGARHAAEIVSILRENSSDGLNLDAPILFQFSDGGPDHRTTYKSVQVASIAVFLALDLDMIVTVRTAPCQSYMNPAERIMSLLNYGLQNVSTARESMSSSQERRIKSLTGLAKVRKESERDEDFKTSLQASVKTVIDLIGERFQRLHWKEEQVSTHNAATQEEISEVMELVKLLDDSVDLDHLQAKDFTRYKALNMFMKGHCRERTYTFQVKKCRDPDCTFCTMSPPRLPSDVFDELHFLPDPKIVDEKFGIFEELYGQDTTDADCPSLKAKPKPSDQDKKNRNVLVSGKVRNYLPCSECEKRRVVYSRTKMTREDELLLLRTKEEVLYSCGMSLLLEGHDKYEAIVVREGLNCDSPIEVQYYAAKFADVCYHCGSKEVVVTEDVQKLQEKFGIVRPICALCLASGKAPAVRSAIQVGKKK